MKNLKLLMPVDFSDQMTMAAEYALNLTSSFIVDVIFIHVLEVNTFVEVNEDGSIDEMMSENIKQLEEHKMEAAEKLSQAAGLYRGKFNSIRSLIKYGPLVDTIINTAEDEDTDMILMGTSGSGGFKEWISGSDTQIVARRSEIPVLTVMCYRQYEPVKNILFVGDFANEAIKPDPIIKTLTEGFGAKLHLLQVSNDANNIEKEKELINAFAEKHGFNNFEAHVYLDNKVLDGISNFDLVNEMNIIVIGTHGRRKMRQLIKGSLAEKLISHLYKPVLVFKI